MTLLLNKMYTQEYYLKHKDRFKKHTKEYQKNHKEKIKVWQRSYYLKNKEKWNDYQNTDYWKEYRKRYYQKNKEKLTIYNKRYNRNYRNAKKAIFVELKGGKCSKCGNIFPLPCYDFHHINPKEKEITLCWLMPNDTLKKEIDKCILLCANCHRLTHLVDNLKRERENH